MKTFFKFFVLMVLSFSIMLAVVNCGKEKKKTEEPQSAGQPNAASDLGQKKEPEKTKGVVLPGLKPTVGGGDFAENTNCLHVKAGEEKNQVEFWREKEGEPGYFFVLKGGDFWGTVAQEDGFMVCFKGAHISVDGDSGYVGNLDYDHSTFTFIGTVVLMKHTFASDQKEPLVFKLVKDKGAVYVEGKGTVITPEGEKIELGD
jgi:hypothetical protein